MSGYIAHYPAEAVGSSWIGREVLVGDASGVLLRVLQYPTAHRTILTLAAIDEQGIPDAVTTVDVRGDTTVTVDTLKAIGGAA